MSRLNEMILRFVDFEDYSDASRESVTGFYQSIGALNSAFQKRINQLTSIHPSVPLGATLEEYIRHQQDLEGKYGVYVEERAVRLPVRERNSNPDVSSQSPASSAPIKPSTTPSGSETPPATTSTSRFTGFNMDAFKSNKSSNSNSADTSPPSSDASVSSKKRRAEKDDRPRKATEVEMTSSQKADTQEVAKSSSVVGRQLTQNASGFFSVKPRPSVSVAQGDAETSGDEPKKPVFAGFGGLSQSSSSADKPASTPPLNFGSLFGSGSTSPSASASNKSKDSSTAPTFPSFFGSLSQTPKDQSDASTIITSNNTTTSTTFSGFSGIGATSGLSLGGFKFGEGNRVPSAKSAGDDEEVDEGDEKDEADVVPIIPVEEQEVAEPDALVSKKCKVLYLDAGAWKSRGIGTAHLKAIDDNAVQLIVRAATSLGAVLLNVRVGKDTKITRNSRKGKEGTSNESVDIFCLPFPAFKGVDGSKPYQFVLKFKDEKEANELYGVVESVRK